MSIEQIKIPDIGGESGEVIEILIAEGDQIEAEQSLLVLESAKASLEVPSPLAGLVKKIHAAVGDQLSEGDLILDLEVQKAGAKRSENQGKMTGGDGATEKASRKNEEPTRLKEEASAKSGKNEGKNHKGSEMARDYGPGQESKVERRKLTLEVPDIGSEQAEVIEIAVAVGDQIAEGDTLVVAESDKASLEIPAEAAGRIEEIHVGEGEQISQGMKLVTISIRSGAADKPQVRSSAESEKPASSDSTKEPTETPRQQPKDTNDSARPSPASGMPPARVEREVYAGPAVRKLARELGVDLARVSASGPRGRIIKEDVHAFVKRHLQEGAAEGSAIPRVAAVDWSKFGPVRTEPMSRIHRLTADNMMRSWLNVPHVTQWDDADVTELEDYRSMLKPEGVARGVRMTPLAFLLRAACKALQEYPQFNASIGVDGQSLVFREYFHIGVAVDTEAGLLVPVIRDVDGKDIWQLASEVAELADKARTNRLKPNEMQGACFTISSLGAIGGRGFAPIVAAPQVGILGVSKSSVQPVWDGETFQPRTMLPLSLSYDHRAVNGADAGRFLTYLVEQLSSVEHIWAD